MSKTSRNSVVKGSSTRRQSIVPAWSSVVQPEDNLDDAQRKQLLKEIEKQFDYHQADKFRRVMRMGFLFLFFVNPLFVVSDYSQRMGTEEDRKENANNFYMVVGFRFAVIMPLCIFCLMFLRSSLYRRRPNLLIWPIFTVGVILILYIILTDLKASRAGLMILYCCVVVNFTPIRSVHLMISNGLLIIGVLVSLAIQSSQIVEIVTSVILLLCCFLVLSITGYQRERGQIENLLQDNHLKQHQKALVAEERVSENLLCSMMPKFLIEQLKARKSDSEVLAEDYKQVTVLFSIIDQFSHLAIKLNPNGVIHTLNIVFSHFDHLLDKFEGKVHKVETVSEVYLTVSGAPARSETHHIDAGNYALAMLSQMPMIRQEIKDKLKSLGSDPTIMTLVDKLNIKIGLHTGPIVAGVVGINNPRYKLFGDTVNTSSRMESTADPGKIGCSDAYRDKFVNDKGIEENFIFQKRPKFQVKGKGMMQTYFLCGVKKEMVGRQLSMTKVIGAGGPAMHLHKALGMVGKNFSTRSFAAKKKLQEKRDKNKQAAEAEQTPEEEEVDLESKVEELGLHKGTAMAESISGNAELVYRELLGKLRESQVELKNQDGGSVAVLDVDGEEVEDLPLYKKELENFQFEMQRHDVLRVKMLKNPVPELSMAQQLWILLGPDPKMIGSRLGNEDEAAMEASYRAVSYNAWLVMQRRYVYMFMAILTIVTLCDWFLSEEEDAHEFCDKDCFTKYRMTLRLAVSLPACIIYLVFTYTRAFFFYQGISTFFTFLIVGACEAGCAAASRDPRYELLALVIMCQYSFSIMSYSSRMLLGLCEALFFAVAVIQFKPAGEERSATDVFWPEVFLLAFCAVFAVPGFREEMINRVRHNNALAMKVQDMRLTIEKEKTSALLHNLLPSSVVAELRNGRTLIADYYQQVTVLFTDMKNFTLYSSKVTCGELVTFLNAMYSRFDLHSVSRGTSTSTRASEQERAFLTLFLFLAANDRRLQGRDHWGRVLCRVWCPGRMRGPCMARSAQCSPVPIGDARKYSSFDPTVCCVR
jgi:class 3 adenylate cyclase